MHKYDINIWLYLVKVAIKEKSFHEIRVRVGQTPLKDIVDLLIRHVQPDLDAKKSSINDVTKVNHPIDDVTIVNHPIDDVIKVNHPIDDVIKVNHPIDDVTIVNHSLMTS